MSTFSSDHHQHAQHIRQLRLLATSCFAFAAALALITSWILPLFDQSPQLITSAPWFLKPVLRWDALHYIHIVQHGYMYEHEWAFFPGLFAVMRIFEKVNTMLGSALTAVLVSTAALFIACDSVVTLYKLSVNLLANPSVALLASQLSLLPSSPVTLWLAPYTEPFFTYLSYRGMYYCTTSEWSKAVVCFALASTMRSNGILLSGFILWGLIVEPILSQKRLYFRNVLASLIGTAIIVAPFVHHQYSAYQHFCTGQSNSTGPEFCDNRLPLIYSYVQRKYWDVGFLRYWTLQQSPNILMAVPPLLVIITFSSNHLRHVLPRLLKNKPADTHPVFWTVRLTSHTIYSLVLCSILLLNSHTQITLRQAASMPVTYWGAAWLVIEHERFGRWWITWSLMWGALSVVLWSVFLPPA